MTDMTAFERQLSDEISGLMGPVRSVDDAAVFNSITAAQSPKGRFESMFSATKFVIAGAIVALFGGFLLAGVLTQQPSEDGVPPVGASASATAQAEQTDTTTVEPDSTTHTDANDTTTAPDLLPGVDLVTEEVEPGVYRVVSDGVRELAGSAWERFHASIVAGLDGSVWILDEDDFYRIGDPATHPATPQTRLDPAFAPRPYVDTDGTLWALPTNWYWDEGVSQAESGRLSSFTDGEWRVRREHVETFAIQPDGTVWVVRKIGPPDEPATLERLDADGWTVFVGPELDPSWNQLLVGPGTHPSPDIDDKPEDVVDYLLNRGSDVASEGLGGFAGNTALDPHLDGLHADVGAGGDTWAYLVVEPPVKRPGQPNHEVPYLVQGRIHMRGSINVNGVTAVYGPESGVPQAASMGYGSETVMRTGPEGRVWMVPQAFEGGRPSPCDGVASFDGQRWTRHLLGLCIHALDVGLDGATWVRARADADRDAPVHTYVITPEAVAGAQ